MIIVADLVDKPDDTKLNVFGLNEKCLDKVRFLWKNLIQSIHHGSGGIMVGGCVATESQLNSSSLTKL